MSFLDMDERLLELAEHFDLVYSPLVDHKEFPENVDLTLVEGAVSSESDLERIRIVRSRTRTLVSLGDCAVTGNVPSMRNPVGIDAILKHAYHDTVDFQPQVPTDGVPPLLPLVRPVHEVVRVDLTVPGCPPSADTIYRILTDLLAGRTPDIGALTRFGA
jgi:NAD-reducing hydrogenase small subunit